MQHRFKKGAAPPDVPDSMGRRDFLHQSKGLILLGLGVRVVGSASLIVVPGTAGCGGSGSSAFEAEALKLLLDAVKIGIAIAHEYLVRNNSGNGLTYQFITRLLDAGGKEVDKYYAYKDVPPGDQSIAFDSGPAAKNAGTHSLYNDAFKIGSVPFPVSS